MIYLYEIKKVLRETRIMILFVILFIANPFFLLPFIRSGQVGVSSSSYSKLWSDIRTMEDEDRLKYINERLDLLEPSKVDSMFSFESVNLTYTSDGWKEKELLCFVRNEIMTVSEYESYRNNIINDAKNMQGVSIFENKGEFSSLNIKKTLSDFQRTRIDKGRAEPSLAVVLFMFFLPSELVSFLFVLAATITIIVNEKQKGQIRILYTTVKGREGLNISKLLFMMTLIFLMLSIIYGENFLILQKSYGFGALSRTIQSIPQYRGSVLKLSVLQAMVLIMIFKYLYYLLIAICLLIIFKYSTSYLQILAKLFIYVSISSVLQFAIKDGDNLSFFKYLNPFALLPCGENLLVYKNLNIFGRPLSRCIIVSWVMIFLLLIAGYIFVIPGHKMIQWNTSHNYKFLKTEGIYSKNLMQIEKMKFSRRIHFSLVIFLLLIFSALRFYSTSSFKSPDEQYYCTYMSYLEILTKNEQDDYIEEEEERYHSILEDQLAESDGADHYTELLPYKAWKKVMKRYQQGRALDEEKSGVRLLYDGGYKLLMGEDYDNDLLTVVVSALLIIILTGSAYAADTENGMEFLLRTTVNGRQERRRTVFIICMIYGISIYIIQNIADFMRVLYYHGIHLPKVCLSSVEIFSDYDGNMSIAQYLIYMYLLRLFFTVVIICIILILSDLMKNTISADILAMMIIILPFFWGKFGFDQLASIGFTDGMFGNLLLNHMLNGERLIYSISLFACSFIIIAYCIFRFFIYRDE